MALETEDLASGHLLRHAGGSYRSYFHRLLVFHSLSNFFLFDSRHSRPKIPRELRWISEDKVNRHLSERFVHLERGLAQKLAEAERIGGA